MTPLWRRDSWNRYRRAHRDENAAHVRAYQRRQRVRIFERDDWRCFYCGAQLDERSARIDHKVPTSRGGVDEDRNKVACCDPCNRRKFTKTHAEFLRLLEAERDGDGEPSWVTEANPLVWEDEVSALQRTLTGGGEA